jgi:hypothetical protein
VTTVTATRVVPGDPASTALLLAGPDALEFWPGIDHVDGVLSPLSTSAPLAGESHRRLIVHTQPPRRTPTAYVARFSVAADGLPTASGTLRVSRQDWAGGPAVPEQGNRASSPAASISLEIRTDVDYDAGVEQEIAAAAHEFLDNVAAFACRTVTA